MLREITQVKQVEGEAPRRWFTDPAMDLHVWGTDDAVQRFELSYDKGVNERSVVWRDGLLQHRGIDDGEGRGLHQKATPLVVADGSLEPAPVIAAFVEHALEMDQQVARQVLAVLLRHGLELRVLSGSEYAAAMRRLALHDDDWDAGTDALRREFRFVDFGRAFAFMSRVAAAAELLDHHPDWCNSYNRVQVTLRTHAKGGPTALDLILARVMQGLAGAGPAG